MPKFSEGDIVRFKIQSPAELAGSKETSFAHYEQKWRSAVVSDPVWLVPDRQAATEGIVWIGVLRDDEPFMSHYRVPEAALELVEAAPKNPPATAPAKVRKKP